MQDCRNMHKYLSTGWFAIVHVMLTKSFFFFIL